MTHDYWKFVLAHKAVNPSPEDSLQYVDVMNELAKYKELATIFFAAGYRFTFKNADGIGVNIVLSLKHSCRNVLRGMLHLPLKDKVQQLPLPLTIKDFLMMSEFM